MTQGLTGFRKIQIGKESIPGTPVAATVQLLGALTMKESLALAQPNEETGALTKITRSTVAGKQAEMKFEGELTFEQFLYLLLMGVKGSVSATPLYPESAQVFTSPATYEDFTTEVGDGSGTTHLAADALATTGYIYIGSSQKFNRLTIDMGTGVNAIASVMSADYSKAGSTWGALTIADGTITAGATLAKDGAVTWTAPSDWAVGTVNSVADLYWVRLKVSVQLSATVDIAGIELSASVYTWTFTPSLLAASSPNAYTIEYGDNVQAYEVEYGMVSGIEISGAPDEALKVSAEMFGRQMTACTFTTLATFPTVEPVLFNKGKLYIDDAWASIGDTQKSATLVEFTLRIDTGLVPLKAADGTLYFSIVAEKARGVELDMTLHWNSTVSLTERAAWAAQTKRALRLQFEGTTLENSYKKTLTLDVWGVYSDWETLTEKDGASVVAVKFTSVGDVTNNHEFSVAVVNGASTV